MPRLRHPCYAHPARHPRAFLGVILSVLAAPAFAVCVPDVTSVVYAQTVPVRFVQQPDVLLHTARSRVIRYQCDASESAALRPMLPGLTYVRDINHAPAYEISPDSPLVTISFESHPDDGSEGFSGDLNALRDNPWYFPAAGNEMSVTLSFYSRGGPMRPQVQRALGSVQVLGSGPAEFQFDIGYQFQGQTCTLANAQVILDPVPAQVMVNQPTAGHKDFTVMMNCGVPGRPVSLEIADATDRSNMGYTLMPAAGSEAGGVAIQLLQGGRQLQMGQVWAHTDSTGAQQAIRFAARYARVDGEVTGGAILGEAVLTANYY